MVDVLRAFVCAVLAGSASVASVPVATAQNDEEAVIQVVHDLFDAMRAQDTAQIRVLFHHDARLVGTAQRDGQPTAQVVPVEAFLESIGRAQVDLNERIWDWEVRIDDNLATVWTKYDFLVGGEFSHCGVDAFQLVRTPEGWRIIQIADTRRREPCEKPPG